MMLIDGRNEVYMIDRDNSVFHIANLEFPYRKDMRTHLSNTLLDGEMIVDKVNGQPIPRYLIYDIIKITTREQLVKLSSHGLIILTPSLSLLILAIILCTLFYSFHLAERTGR
ncbi:mRNA-capping enzyme isoform X1 [Tachysurus ichikawai]